MRKIFALLALVLGVVSCQTEPEGFDATVGGEKEVNLTVSLPEATRSNSALGAFGNVDFTKYDVRFQCEVHYGTEKKTLETQYSDNGKSATFPVRLIPGRNYTFVVWADLVEQGETTDLHYKTTDGLSAITLIGEWNAMDDTRDAYTCSEVHNFTGASDIALTLTRPFAKLRVKTTDMHELLGVDPAKAKVTYSTDHYTSFDALNQTPGTQANIGDHDTFAIVEYTENEGENKKTLFADYFFATAQQEVVNFTLEVMEENGTRIIERTFNTPIPVKRNTLTTIEGNILTMGDNITVTVVDEFANAQTPNEAPYYQQTISSAAELFAAFKNGGEYILLDDLNISNLTITTLAATRTSGSAAIVDLNGKTITVDNQGAEALYTVATDEQITFVGEGTIELTEESTAPFIANEGTVEVTSGEVINNEVLDVNVFSVYVNYVDELRKAFETGGEYTMVYDVVYPETLVLEAGKSLVLNLNGKTISQSKECTGNYNMVYNKGELTINGDGAISFKDTGAGDPNFGWGSYTLRNEGTLVVNGGTIEHLGEQNPGNGQPNVHMYCAIFQYSGKSTINGGVISTPTYRSARLWNGEMTINGGQFVGQLWLQAVSDNANLVINGGEFVACGNDGSSVFVSNSGKAVKCSINGGFFYNKVGMSEPIACIAGGEFTPAAKEATSEELLAEGYEFAELENGNWTVVYVISDNEDLINFVDAVKNGNTFHGQTVKLGADIDLTGVTTDVDSFGPIGRYCSGQGVSAPFEGHFDGQGHTIKGIYQSGWDFGYEWGRTGYLGLFGYVKDATIENLTIEGMTAQVEGGTLAAIAGRADGECTFKNITVKNTNLGTYNNRCGGIVGWTGGYYKDEAQTEVACYFTFENINICEDVVLGGLWGSFDSSIGGIMGQLNSAGSASFKNVTVSCRIDAYNDCTASYDYYLYRMCGMLIGQMTKTTTIDGSTYPDVAAYGIEFDNVVVNYGKWMNYHYCEPTPGYNGGRGMRVEAGFAYDGLPADYDHSQCVDNHYNCIPFDQLFGGTQTACKGVKAWEGVTVNYPAEYTCDLCGENHNVK